MTTEERMRKIEERWQVPIGSQFDVFNAQPDVDWLLQRLKDHRACLSKISSMAYRHDDYYEAVKESIELAERILEG